VRCDLLVRVPQFEPATNSLGERAETPNHFRESHRSLLQCGSEGEESQILASGFSPKSSLRTALVPFAGTSAGGFGSFQCVRGFVRCSRVRRSSSHGRTSVRLRSSPFRHKNRGYQICRCSCSLKKSYSARTLGRDFELREVMHCGSWARRGWSSRGQSRQRARNNSVRLSSVSRSMAQRKCSIGDASFPWNQSWMVLFGTPINAPNSFWFNSCPSGRSAASISFFRFRITSYVAL
jgi:hypothetical protein